MELFTSEGCSSCPPADRLLAEIDAASRKTRQSVFVLSYHVDYWNDLGWPDPYSLRKCTVRQRAYVTTLRGQGLYTPQMIVNGRAEFVGSDRQRAVEELEAALAQMPTGKIEVTAAVNDQGIDVNVEVPEVFAAFSVLAALVQRHAKQQVTAGENEDRTLTHVHVVRDFNVLKPEPDAFRQVLLAKPGNFQPREFEVIAFVQSIDGKILAAASTQIRE